MGSVSKMITILVWLALRFPNLHLLALPEVKGTNDGGMDAADLILY